MADISWIKLVTDVYKNRKIRLIRKRPNGDSLFTVWVALMCIAGDANENGEVSLSHGIPYTEEMLAIEVDEPLAIIKYALSTFEQFGMIERENGVIKITNWTKYQSVDKLAEIREYNRQAQQRRRSRVNDNPSECQTNVSDSVNDNPSECQTNVNDSVNDMSMTSQTNVNDMSMTSQTNVKKKSREEEEEERSKEEEIRRDIDIEGEGEEEGDAEGETAVVPPSSCPYAKIREMYHELCPSFPQIKSIDGSRRKAVAARWRVNPSLDTFGNLFSLAEASSFLKGANDRNWSADFDWMMKQGNFTKILEHRYDDKGAMLPQTYQNTRQKPAPYVSDSFDIDADFTAALKRSYGGIDPRETGITYGESAGESG